MSTGSSEAKPLRTAITDGAEAKPLLAKRLAWFAGLWVAGLAATASVAYTLRAILG